MTLKLFNNKILDRSDQRKYACPEEEPKQQHQALPQLMLREVPNLHNPNRDRAILLEVKLQTDAGDPSPSVTVARDYGLKPDAVRQVVKRTLDRLRVLAEREPRFAGLIELPILR